MTSAAPIPVIIDRHAEDAAFLWLLRDEAIASPHYCLDDLAELDNRLEANLDGLRIAGETAWEVCKSALEIGEPGEIFVAAVIALASADGHKVDTVLAAAQGNKENLRAFVSALGWLDFQAIEGLTGTFCNANQAIFKYLGVTGHAIHRVDPGPALERGLSSDNPLLRARSLKAVGELGRADLLDTLQQHWTTDDEASRFWSIWSALLLGNHAAESLLQQFVYPDSAFAENALQIAMRVMGADPIRNWLSDLAQQDETMRYALIGAGCSGDPLYIPSLLNQMLVPAHARIAGEAFSLITGADLAYLDLDMDEPEGHEGGPTEDPEDEDVELEADESLPWPDRLAIDQWWSANQQRFNAGERYLCGERICAQQCEAVLKTGYQRQRRGAALELALMGAAGGLFETRSPGFRQKIELAKWGGVS